MNEYIGHPLQTSGVEEVSLCRGKGKGMVLLNIRNGKGLELTLSADRCMDISRVFLKGTNFGYFAPCGYVSPMYYDSKGTGFLKSFTAGFLTTCGLNAVGTPCTDNGEETPLHGTISNTPAESYYYIEDDGFIKVTAQIRSASLFGDSYLLTRTYSVSKTENKISVSDNITNIGNTYAPLELLYHINFGYPILTEKSKVYIPNNKVLPRNDHAKEFIDSSLLMEKPQSGYEECCYYYDVKEKDGFSSVGIFSPDEKKGAKISFAKKTLKYFTQWKMMGKHEYVLGLEPGNCTPDGRDIMRQRGELTILAPGEEYFTELNISFSENEEDIKC